MALLHVVAALGGVGYLVGTGRLTAERTRAIVAILRGESEMEAMPAADPAVADDHAEQMEEATSGEDAQVEEEIEWRNIDRYRAQLEQRLKLINAARVDLDRQREAFEQVKEQERLAREERAQSESQPGYQKELELVSALSPVAALGQIMTMSDGDAAQLLFQLGTRKVKKIYESARTEEERAKLTTVRQLIRDFKPGNGMAGAAGATG
jgi:hypothetical protein